MLEDAARLEDEVAAGGRVRGSTSGAAAAPAESPAAQLARVRAQLTALNAELKAGAADENLLAVRRRGLLIRQFRERATLTRRLGLELKGMGGAGVAPASGVAAAAAAVASAPATPGGGDLGGDAAASGSAAAHHESDGDGDDDGAGDGPVAGSGAGKPGGSAPHATRGGGLGGRTAESVLALAAPQQPVIGVRLCPRCGTHYARSGGSACSECGRELCGRGGRSDAEPLGWPCIAILRCPCNTSICYDCFTAVEAREEIFWGRCADCGRALCPKETASAGCGDCGAAPFCKPCRTSHGPACPAGR